MPDLIQLREVLGSGGKEDVAPELPALKALDRETNFAEACRAPHGCAHRKLTARTSYSQRPRPIMGKIRNCGFIQSQDLGCAVRIPMLLVIYFETAPKPFLSELPSVVVGKEEFVSRNYSPIVGYRSA